MSNIEQELKKIFSAACRRKESRINGKSKIIDDLGVDSFTSLEIIVQIENLYNITVSESALKKLVTFQDVVNLLNKNLNKSSAQVH